MNFSVEHEGEGSLSAKRRNDDDDGCTDKETMETDLVNDCKARSIPKQDHTDKNRSTGETVVAALGQETLTTPGRSADQKNEKNVPKHLEEVENSDDLKFVEGTVENNEESVSSWTEELVEQLQDLRRKEAEDSGNIIMENISKHKESNIRSNFLDESINSCQNFSEVQNGITFNSNPSDSAHNNRSVEVQSSKIHSKANEKKWDNNFTSSKILYTESDEMKSTLEASELFPSPTDLDAMDDKIMWQNNRLYKNKAETSSAMRYGLNNKDGDLVDIGSSSNKSEILKTSNSELEQDNRHLITSVKEGKNFDDNDNYDDNNNDDGDSDDDDDDDDGSANSRSSDTEDQENNPERNCANPCSQDENDLYLAVRHTAQSMSAAVGDQVIFRINRFSVLYWTSSLSPFQA